MIRKTVLLIIGVCILSSCSSPIKAPEVKVVVRGEKRLTDEERFFSDDGFREKLLKKCSNKQFVRQSSYGNWSGFEKCDFAFNGINLELSGFGVHESQKGEIDAFEFMVLPGTEYGKSLLEKFRPYRVHRGSAVCAKYYNRTLPVITIAKSQLCEALEYDQL